MLKTLGGQIVLRLCLDQDEPPFGYGTADLVHGEPVIGKTGRVDVALQPDRSAEPA